MHDSTPIVTACDESYLPGLVALHNSYLRHSADGFSFCAIIEGSQEFAEHVYHDLGIHVFHAPVFSVANYPVSRVYPEPLPLFYSRLLVPSLFQGKKKSIYIDTDSLILQSLQPLVDADYGDYPVAATRSNSPQSKEFVGGKEDVYGPMSSLYVFNHEPWFEKRVLDRCVEVMENEPTEYITIAQAVLQWVVGDDWYELPWETQAHAGHRTWVEYPKKRIFTLHFMGTNPWDEYKNGIVPTPLKLELRELWKTYASQS